jgi:hypothetical protein
MTNYASTAERDRLYLDLTAAGIPPQRAAEMVSKAMPYSEPQPVPAEQPKPSTVRVKEMRAASTFRYDRIPTALFGFAVFGLWWAVGGKYTIDGTPLALNWILRLFHGPAAFSPVTDWHLYIYLIWIPVCMSVVERRNAPRKGIAYYGILSVAFFVWCIVATLDFGSTYMAITNPDPNAIVLAYQIANTPLLAVLWTSATTFLPEACLTLTWRYLSKG